MATYFFSALANGQTVPFDNTLDTVYFDNPAISAASITASAPLPSTFALSAAGKTVSFDIASSVFLASTNALVAIDSFNVMFADGSRLIVGDDLTVTTFSSFQTFGINDDSANTLVGGDFNDQLLGLGGDDTLVGGLGNDVLNGGTGTDTASYADATAGVTANLSLAGAQPTGGAGADTLISIENLLGSNFNDTLTGNAGDNVIEGGNGNDAINGGGGIDTASYAGAAAAVRVNLGLAGAQPTLGAGADTLSNIENLLGSRFGDTLTGNAQNNLLDGSFGSDTLAGGAGNDTYRVDSSGDVINEAAGEGTDTVIATVSHTLAANVENLTLLSFGIGPSTSIFPSAGAGIDGTGNTLNNVITGDSFENVMDGGGGTDMVSYATAGAGVSVNLAFTSPQNTGSAGRDTLRNFENITGSAFNDRLFGNAGNNLIVGAAGNDQLSGGAGNDTLNGSAGTDTAYYGTVANGVTVNLALTTAQNTVNAGTDTLTGIENLTGSGFADTLTGDATNNVIEGLGGNDTINGAGGVDTASYASAASAVTVNLGLGGVQPTLGAGFDTLSNIENLLGSAFNDTLTGSAANNRIVGGGGGDTMAGGAGNDTYVVESSTTQTIRSVAGTLTFVTAPDGTTFAPDVVTEGAGAGADTVETFVSFTLPDNVENLVARDLPSLPSFGFGLGLTGNALDNLIVDGGGNNTIDGAGGFDTVSFQNATARVTVNLNTSFSNAFGFGSDQLRSIEGVITSPFDDSIIVFDAGPNAIDGGNGIDTVTYTDTSGSGVTVNLALTTPQDTGAGGTDTLRNIENVTGTSNADRLTGNAANNVLNGSFGRDTLEGGLGNDTIAGYQVGGLASSDTEIDTASYAGATAGVTVNLGLTGPQNTVGAGIDTITGIEDLIGGAFNDTLVGTVANNVLDGGAGNDSLLASAGDDTLIGGAGNDTLGGGAGIDTALYDTAPSGVTVNLGVTTAQNTVGAGTDTLAAIEDLVGSDFADTLTGNNLANLIEGGGGNDTLNGAAGIDTVTYASAAAGVTVNLAQTLAQNTTGAGTDTLAGFENLTGSAFNDTLTGSAGDNVLKGGLGDDVLDGGNGIDTVSYADFDSFSGVIVNLVSGGASGEGFDTLANIENVIGSDRGDTITGNANPNVLAGGPGTDFLVGGDGADIFVFDSLSGSDNIPDFVSGTDRFRFSQAAIRIGDGDLVVEGGIVVPGPGGFAPTAELVIVTNNVTFVSTSTAAAAIGSATAAYAAGDTRLFAVDNGSASAVLLFTSAGNDAVVSAEELTFIASANTTPATVLADYVFVV